jgi:hypothetical protein
MFSGPSLPLYLRPGDGSNPDYTINPFSFAISTNASAV